MAKNRSKVHHRAIATTLRDGIFVQNALSPQMTSQLPHRPYCLFLVAYL